MAPGMIPFGSPGSQDEKSLWIRANPYPRGKSKKIPKKFFSELELAFLDCRRQFGHGGGIGRLSGGFAFRVSYGIRIFQSLSDRPVAWVMSFFRSHWESRISLRASAGCCPCRRSWKVRSMASCSACRVAALAALVAMRWSSSAVGG